MNENTFRVNLKHSDFIRPHPDDAQQKAGLATIPPDEWRIAAAIVERAGERAKMARAVLDKKDMLQVILYCHCMGNPIHLKRLLMSSDTDFVHDVFGLMLHFDKRAMRPIDGFELIFAQRKN
jgi:hypothetical protein